MLIKSQPGKLHCRDKPAAAAASAGSNRSRSLRVTFTARRKNNSQCQYEKQYQRQYGILLELTKYFATFAFVGPPHLYWGRKKRALQLDPCGRATKNLDPAPLGCGVETSTTGPGLGSKLWTQQVIFPLIIGPQGSMPRVVNGV